MLDSDSHFCVDCGTAVEATDAVASSTPSTPRAPDRPEVPSVPEQPIQTPVSILTPTKRRWPFWTGATVVVVMTVLGYRSCTALQRQFDEAIQRGDLASASPTSAYSTRERARQSGDTDKVRDMDSRALPLVQARSDELFARWYKEADLIDTNWRDTLRLETWHAELNPANTNHARLEFASGQNAMLDQKFSEAYQHFQKSLNYQANWPLALNGLGKACVNLKQSCDEEYYLKAIAADPSWVFPYQNLGGVYLRHGRLSESEATYRKAVSLDPARAGSRSLLAELLLDKGKSARADACGEFRAALQLAEGKPRPGFNVNYAQQRFHKFCQ